MSHSKHQGFTDEVLNKIEEYYSRAYAPYSKFHVSSAVKFQDNDEIYFGCNIENDAYGSCMCAERVAIFKGISDHGKQIIDWIALKTNSDTGDMPCGGCIQVINEFADQNTNVLLIGKNNGQPGIVRTLKFTEILPIKFDNKFFQDMRDDYNK